MHTCVVVIRCLACQFRSQNLSQGVQIISCAVQVCSNIFMRNMLTSETLYANNSQIPRDLVFPSSQVARCMAKK